MRAFTLPGKCTSVIQGLIASEAMVPRLHSWTHTLETAILRTKDFDLMLRRIVSRMYAGIELVGHGTRFQV